MASERAQWTYLCERHGCGCVVRDGLVGVVGIVGVGGGDAKKLEVRLL